MKTVIRSHRMALVSGTAAALAVAAMGFAGTAQARDNVYWSVGVGTPGAVVNVANALPVYSQPQVIYNPPPVVYTQPQVVYTQPAPVYVQPRPYYYGQPQVVYTQPQVVYGHPGKHHGWHKKNKHDRDDDHRGHGYYGGSRYGYQQGYAPVYYQR